jgi:hypothetical protein
LNFLCHKAAFFLTLVYEGEIFSTGDVTRMSEHEPIQIVFTPEKKPVQILTETDTAQYIGMSREWLRLARRRRLGPPYFKFGKSIRYAVPDLDKFLETHRVKPK